jgi:hypothetical protein
MAMNKRSGGTKATFSGSELISTPHVIFALQIILALRFRASLAKLF